MRCDNKHQPSTIAPTTRPFNYSYNDGKVVNAPTAHLFLSSSAVGGRNNTSLRFCANEFRSTTYHQEWGRWTTVKFFGLCTKLNSINLYDLSFEKQNLSIKWTIPMCKLHWEENISDQDNNSVRQFLNQLTTCWEKGRLPGVEEEFLQQRMSSWRRGRALVAEEEFLVQRKSSWSRGRVPWAAEEFMEQSKSSNSRWQFRVADDNSV